MKVIIDGNGLVAGTGISTYIRSLIAHIARVDHDNEYVIFSHFFNDYGRKREIVESAVPRQDNFRLDCRRFPESLAFFLERGARVRLTEHLLAGSGADVFHGTGNLLPRLKNTASVLTAHHFYAPGDPLFPPAASRRERAYFQATADAVRDSTRVIAVSRFTADELERHFPGTREKTTVVHEAIADHFSESASVSAPYPPEQYGIRGPFIYCSGPLNERKNIARLIDAFALLRKKGRRELLFISGFNEGSYAGALKRRWGNQGLRDAVVTSGYIPPEELPAVYRAARLFVYPSLLEGFGLPPLEAMACGCPVVASRAASLPEVVGEGGMLFDPFSPEDIARKMEILLSDENERELLIARGRENIRRFSWDKAARETIDAYRSSIERFSGTRRKTAKTGLR